MSYSDDFEQWKENIENVPAKDVTKKVICIREGGSNADICKLLILSAPVGFDPPRGLFTVPSDF
jgi:hypothetical protein